MCNIAHLLLGDLTRESVETAALRLLDSLVLLEDKDDSVGVHEPCIRKKQVLSDAYTTNRTNPGSRSVPSSLWPTIWGP